MKGIKYFYRDMKCVCQQSYVCNEMHKESIWLQGTRMKEILDRWVVLWTEHYKVLIWTLPGTCHFAIRQVKSLSQCLTRISPGVFVDGAVEVNPLTLKIWLLILPSSCYTFPYKLITRIWCLIKITSCTW